MRRSAQTFGGMRYYIAGFAILFVGIAQADDCTFYAKTGAKVSPRSDECVMIEGAKDQDDDKKTGFERCTKRDDKNKILSDIHWRNGKRDGAAFYHDYNDRRIVATFKDDLAEGAAQVFSKENKLLCEMQFNGGVASSAVRERYPSGKLKAAYEMAKKDTGHRRIELNEDGKIHAMQCAKTSMVPEDIEPCGFNGKTSTVQLHDSDGKPIRNVSSWRNGNLLKLVTVDRKGLAMVKTFPSPGSEDDFDVEISHPNGKLATRYSTRKNYLYGLFSQFSEEGTLLRETDYEKDRPKSEKQYFMNGKLKRSVAKTDNGALKAEEYWDNGKLKNEGIYAEDQYARGSWDYLSPDGRVLNYSRDGQLQSEQTFKNGRLDGLQKSYFGNGKLGVEQIYKKDNIVMMKCYDPSGNLEFTEDYFDDGSRKSSSVEMTEQEREQKKICRLDR